MVALEVWYCDNIVAGPWPFLLLLLPLAGAYFYGRKQHRRGWMMIGVWIPIQLALTLHQQSRGELSATRHADQHRGAATVRKPRRNPGLSLCRPLRARRRERQP